MTNQHAASFPPIKIAIAICILSLTVTAQTRSATDGSTPLGLQPGAPAGSYALSGFDNVNLFNGGLSFQLSLLSVAGRGGTQMPVMLPIEGKWRVLDLAIPQSGGTFSHHYMPVQTWWENNDPKYRPGSVVARQGSFDVMQCPDNTNINAITLTRLTFTSPDGTEFELRDQLTGGQAANNTGCNYSNPPSRSRVFVTSDGSAATFVSDTTIYDYVINPNPSPETFPSGYLMLRDGTRFRVEAGSVTWMRDRNGNKFTFGYDANHNIQTITDSLNRVVTITRNTGPGTFDQITYKGFGGAQRIIKVNYSLLVNALRADYSTTRTYKSLFPELDGSTTTNHNPSVVSSITLPNNQQYLIKCNQYGEIARVVLPTGGAIEYDYAAGVSTYASGAFTGGFESSWVVYRRVTERRVYPDGGTGSTYASRMTYTVSSPGVVTVDQLNNSGTLLTRNKHYFYGNAATSFGLGPTDYSGWKESREYQTEAYASDGTTILRRSVNTWEQPIATNAWPLTQPETNTAVKTNNPQITQTVNTIEPAAANLVSKQTFAYDKYTNQTDVYEYDFGAGAVGPLMRRSHTDYLASSYDTLNPSSANPDLSLTSHIRNLPAQVSIFDSGNVERARSTIEYDNYVLDGADCLHSFHCPLQSRANISGFDSLLGTSYTMRGNVTRATKYLLSNGTVTGSVSSYSHYDIAGNVIRAIDPRSTASNVIVSSIEYDDRFGAPDGEARANSVPSELTGFASFAFPTKVTNALGHISYAQFDYYLGKAVNGEDTNGVVAAGYFSDFLDRPTQVRRAIGTGAANQTSFGYDDANRLITTSSDKDAYGDNLLVSKILYDQMGRPKETRQYEGGSNYIVTVTQYDALGRAFKTSNPYRPLQSETAVWTTQAFDALGRMVSVTTPDGAIVATAYSGDRVLVTDQAGKQRLSRTNALGQLKDVWEITAADLATEAVSFPSHPEVTAGYRTSYDYNVLDNLKTVAQGSQTRNFDYDSLARLKSATNPESGTVTYDYDNNSNLTLKTDARNVTTTYGYDALNRNTSISYSDGTMAVGRAYDQTTNGKGRLSWEWQCANAGNCGSLTSFNYDALGRVADQHQQFWIGGNWGPAYNVYRAYDLAGNVTSQTYPSGHTVSYSYDAAARTLTFTGNLGDGLQRTYAAGIEYAPFGGIKKEQFGTQQPVYHHQAYNIRGQLYYVAVGPNNDDWGGDYGKLIYYYGAPYCFGCSGPENNGNVRLIDYYLPGGYVLHDYYDYDALNRLSDHLEEDTAQQFRQHYSYDRYGNRTIDQTLSWGNINRQAFTVTAANNRLGVPAGQAGAMDYDVAGNLINDTYSGAGYRTYDAENRIVSAWGGNSQAQYYSYNAGGQRVRRKVDGIETWQIYGIEGELVAEYAANGAVSSPKKEYGYRNGQLLVTADGATNVALAANGATATASSTSAPYVAAFVNDGSRRAINGSVWADNTLNSFPDWVEVSFNGSKTISEIDVVTQQDDYQNPVEPTLAQTFSLYGVTAFEVQYWNGSAWTTVPGATVTGNNKVWRQFTFSSITTSKIRVMVNAGADNAYSRVVEVEAWSQSGTRKVNWLVPDHLGTPRMIFDQTGSVANLKRHDYLPFGEELFAGTGGRTAAQGYSVGDGVRQQFTSKERDNETGLDYFQHRYYSSTQGRFTSVDPENIGASISNPQSWNGYAYALNSPGRYVDPEGLKVRICGTDGHCTSGSTDLSDEDWDRYFRHQKDIKVKNGNIYQNGTLIGTYQRLSFDDLNDFANGVIFGRGNTAGLTQRLPIVQTVVTVGAVIDVGLIAGVTIVTEMAGSAVVDELATMTARQQQNISKVYNVIRDHLSEKDISGLIRDVSNNPVPRSAGRVWNHYQETTDAVRALQGVVGALQGSLRNPNLAPAVRAEIEQAIQVAQNYITRVDKIIGSH
jgi:RHS repeat-associated protein